MRKRRIGWMLTGVALALCAAGCFAVGIFVPGAAAGSRWLVFLAFGGVLTLMSWGCFQEARCYRTPRLTTPVPDTASLELSADLAARLQRAGRIPN